MRDDMLISELVAVQMRTTTAAIYRGITYASLGVLVAVSAAFASVQVWVLRGYLPDTLPAPAAWALPVALQVLVMAAELILLSAAVTHSWSVQAVAGAIMALGYGGEITAHIHEGGAEADIVTVAMVLMSVLLGLCWTLLALALRAGIADADALVHAQRDADTAGPDSTHRAPEPAHPTPQFDTPTPEPAHPAPQFDTDDVPEPGGRMDDAELDMVVTVLVTEIEPPRSYREMETRFRELGYVAGAKRLRDSYSRVTGTVTAAAVG